MYDNGNYRAAAFEPVQNEYSRAVIYQIDEGAMTVGQVWSYGEPSGMDSFFSTLRGDADWQPTTGNVVMVNGTRRNAANLAYAEILEITPDGRRVFELTVGDPSDALVDARSQSIYRAQRLADIRQ